MTSEFTIAIHALVYLRRRGGWLASDQLADNICTNPARVRKVMAQLAHTGLIDTREGAVGGYHFSRDPDKVTLKEVGDALAMQYVNSSWRSGKLDCDCLVSSGMGNVMDGLLHGMNDACGVYLKTVTLADIDHQIFGDLPPDALVQGTQRKTG